MRKSGNFRKYTGILAEALADAGFQSVRHACLAAGVQPTRIGNLINGKSKLVGIHGNVDPAAKKFAEVLGETPERLFDVSITLSVTVREHGDCDASDRACVREIIAKALTPRELGVIHGIFWEQRTLDSIAADYNVGRERVRQIAAKAMRKLRHPARAKTLRGCLDGSY